MAKNMNNKRTERTEKNSRSMNRALELLTAGFIAEFYLLMINNYFVKGSVGQVLTMMTVLKVLLYAGLALVAAGIVLTVLSRKKSNIKPALSGWLLIIGVFFTLSSELMLKIYPAGTTAMIILVPVVMILGIIFLLYQREFSVQAMALALSILAMILLGRGAGKESWALVVKGYAVFAMIAVAAIEVFCTMAQKNDGCIGNLRVFPPKADYRLAVTVPALCFVAILAALFASGVAYYGMWALSVVLFVLAVYYTVKML